MELVDHSTHRVFYLRVLDSARPPRRLARRTCRYSAEALRGDLIVATPSAAVVAPILPPTLAHRPHRVLTHGPLTYRIECRARRRCPPASAAGLLQVGQDSRAVLSAWVIYLGRRRAPLSPVRGTGVGSITLANAVRPAPLVPPVAPGYRHEACATAR